DYLLAENRVLREAHGSGRIRLTDDQRRRLAAKGTVLGRRRLAGIVGIVTPDTILRWYRKLVPEVRRIGDAAPRSTDHEAGHRGAHCAHGERESDLGLHAYSGRTEAHRPRCRAEHD